MMINSFLQALLVFIVSVAIHLIICRIYGTPKFMFRGLLQGILTVMAIGIWQIWEAQQFVVTIYLFFAMWCTYLICFINLFNSLTLKMLEILANAPNSTIGPDGFDRYFTDDESVGARVAAMELNGFIAREGQIVSLQPKAKILVWVVLTIRKFFSIKEIG